jgi:lysophospholipase L1-like esterase
MKYLTAIIVIACCLYVGRQSVRYIPSITHRHAHHTYDMNENYAFQTSMYPLYTGRYDIVMFGDSQIEHVKWGELLHRGDIANYGIGGDITDGLLHRIDKVVNCTPKMCFIECGINDIRCGISPEETIKNLSNIISILKKHGVRVVLFQVACVAKSFADAKEINEKVLALNDMTQRIPNIEIIDLNKYLSSNGYLQPEYALQDGIHLSPKACVIMANQMNKYL